MTPDQSIQLAIQTERARCATICYVKAYEFNAMGAYLTPGQAAEACARAIEASHETDTDKPPIQR